MARLSVETRSRGTQVDEQTLAKQLAETGNIMDLARDEDWIRESAQIELECNGRIEAGLAMRAYAQAKYDDSLDHVRRQLRQKMRLQSILFVELKCWMEEWDIGQAFEATYTEARRLVRKHLELPLPVLEEWVEAVLAEDTQVPEDADKPVRAQTRVQLSLMMTDEDWETLARVAATTAAEIAADGVHKASQVNQKVTVAA